MSRLPRTNLTAKSAVWPDLRTVDLLNYGSVVIYSNTTSVNMNTPSVNTEHVCAFRSLVSPTPVLTQV